MKAFQVLPPNKILLPLVNPSKLLFTYFSPITLISPKLIYIKHQKLINQIQKQNYNKDTGDTCKLTPVKLLLTQSLKDLFKRPTQGEKVLKFKNQFIKFQIHEKYGIIKNQIPLKIFIKENGQIKIQLKPYESIQEQFI